MAAQSVRLSPAVSQGLKKVVQALEQETAKRVSTKTIKRLIKKTAMSGNGSGKPPPKRLIHASTSVAKY